MSKDALSLCIPIIMKGSSEFYLLNMMHLYGAIFMIPNFFFGGGGLCRAQELLSRNTRNFD